LQDSVLNNCTPIGGVMDTMSLPTIVGCITSRMTSLNEDETPGTANRVKNYALFEFLPEFILECGGPIEWPVTQTFTNIERWWSCLCSSL